MEFKKYHRKYPDIKWNYKAISTKVGNKEIVFYTLRNKGKQSRGVETYSGSNYNVRSTAKSYSQNYNLRSVPAVYKNVLQKLIRKHKSTKWSKAKRVDYN
jgi:hypothetical protein